MILAACGVTFLMDKGIPKSLTKGSIFSITISSLLLMSIIQMAYWSSQPESLPWIPDRQYRIIQYINKHIPNNAVIISYFSNPLTAEYYFTENTTADIRVYISLSIPKKSWAGKGQVKLIRYDPTIKYSFLFLPDGTLNPRTYNFIGLTLKKGVPVYLVHLRYEAVCIKFFPMVNRYFTTIEQNGDGILFRLYRKDW